MRYGTKIKTAANSLVEFAAVKTERVYRAERYDVYCLSVQVARRTLTFQELYHTLRQFFKRGRSCLIERVDRMPLPHTPTIHAKHPRSHIKQRVRNLQARPVRMPQHARAIQAAKHLERCIIFGNRWQRVRLPHICESPQSELFAVPQMVKRNHAVGHIH